MSLQLSDAKKLIIQFVINQIEATHQANTKRGITKKNKWESIFLLQKLLSGLTGENISKKEATLFYDQI